MTRVEAEDDLIDAFLYYSNWDGDTRAPHALEIPTKREGYPHRWILTDIPYPLLCVQCRSRTTSGARGRQVLHRLAFRLWYVRKFSEGEYIETQLRTETGKIEENILASDRLGRDWVTALHWQATVFDNEFERLLRATSSEFMAAAIDFEVELVEPT